MNITLTQGLMMIVDSLERKTVSPCTTGDHRPTIHTRGGSTCANGIVTTAAHSAGVSCPCGLGCSVVASVSCFLMLCGKARWEYNKGQNWLCAKLGQEHRFRPTSRAAMLGLLHWASQVLSTGCFSTLGGFTT